MSIKGSEQEKTTKKNKVLTVATEKFPFQFLIFSKPRWEF